MKIRIDAHFFSQVQRYNFKFTCEDCAYYCHERQACVHDFPCHMHQNSQYFGNIAATEVLFCKQFECE